MYEKFIKRICVGLFFQMKKKIKGPVKHYIIVAKHVLILFKVYSIEVHTGKQKMAGTDSNIYITLIGVHGSSKKIHLADPSSDKKLFEKNSIDKFKIMIPGVGELKRIRIEHDGKGFAAGWFLNKVRFHVFLVILLVC